MLPLLCNTRCRLRDNGDRLQPAPGPIVASTAGDGPGSGDIRYDGAIRDHSSNASPAARTRSTSTGGAGMGRACEIDRPCYSRQFESASLPASGGVSGQSARRRRRQVRCCRRSPSRTRRRTLSSRSASLRQVPVIETADLSRWSKRAAMAASEPSAASRSPSPASATTRPPRSCALPSPSPAPVMRRKTLPESQLPRQRLVVGTQHGRPLWTGRSAMNGAR